MDDVQKFVSENQHQFGYVMQVANEQWKKKDPVGALTVGPCNYYIEKHGDYHTVLDKLQSNERATVMVLDKSLQTTQDIRLICERAKAHGVKDKYVDDILKLLKGDIQSK